MSWLECNHEHVGINSCKKRGDGNKYFRSMKAPGRHRPDMESPKLNRTFNFLILKSQNTGTKHAKKPTVSL